LADFSIVEVPAPVEFVGKTLREIGLRSRFGLTTIAIKHATRAGERDVTNSAPGPDDVVPAGDVLSLLGSNERLGQLDRTLNRPPKKRASESTVTGGVSAFNGRKRRRLQLSVVGHQSSIKDSDNPPESN
jgi:hypothetical protein